RSSDLIIEYCSELSYRNLLPCRKKSTAIEAQNAKAKPLTAAPSLVYSFACLAPSKPAIQSPKKPTKTPLITITTVLNSAPNRRRDRKSFRAIKNITIKKDE